MNIPLTPIRFLRYASQQFPNKVGVVCGAERFTYAQFAERSARLAGALVVPIFSLSADLGVRFLIQGFLAVMLGGVGTFEGSVAGGAVIGVMSAALPWLVAPVLADVLVFVIAVVFVVINLAVDILYAWLDPRIRYA